MLLFYVLVTTSSNLLFIFYNQNANLCLYVFVPVLVHQTDSQIAYLSDMDCEELPWKLVPSEIRLRFW